MTGAVGLFCRCPLMGQTTSFFPTSVSQTQNLNTDFEPERIIYTPLDSTGTRFLVLSCVVRPVTLLWRLPQWLLGLKLSYHGSTPQEWIPRQTAAGGVGYTGRGILEVKTVNELAYQLHRCFFQSPEYIFLAHTNIVLRQPTLSWNSDILPSKCPLDSLPPRHLGRFARRNPGHVWCGVVQCSSVERCRLHCAVNVCWRNCQ
ncbi:hypothetical protein QR685DRAFT_530062 [Neurospora intermedia]|uniref:Uncharacterized protein n=1 Tax=Neurospora intermedia TaxID=5142 RepID=A0ABR3DBI2_NEUIN